MRIDKIADHQDWKDGINQFRLVVLRELETINKEIKTLKQTIKGETP